MDLRWFEKYIWCTVEPFNLRTVPSTMKKVYFRLQCIWHTHIRNIWIHLIQFYQSNICPHNLLLLNQPEMSIYCTVGLSPFSICNIFYARSHHFPILVESMKKSTSNQKLFYLVPYTGVISSVVIFGCIVQIGKDKLLGEILSICIHDK